MAFSPTPANVLAGTGAVTKQGTSGATIVAGKVVYKDVDDGKYKLASNDAEETSIVAGIALNNASNGQPISVQTGGQIEFGAAGMLSGQLHVLATAGQLDAPPLVDGTYSAYLGMALDNETLDLQIQANGTLYSEV